MIKFITFLLLFSIPILLILIVNLRRRQRIVYTHTLRIELYNSEKDIYEEFHAFNHISYSETYSEIRLKQEGLFRLTGPDTEFPDSENNLSSNL